MKSNSITGALVPIAGVEPACPKASDFESGVTASSTRSAFRAREGSRTLTLFKAYGSEPYVTAIPPLSRFTPCDRGESNSHALTSTSTSSWRDYRSTTIAFPCVSVTRVELALSDSPNGRLTIKPSRCCLSRRSDSNRLPRPYQGLVHPHELHRRKSAWQDSNLLPQI